jgi:hypothetical protein
MFWAFLAVAAAADWVPARWASSDPATLDLVKATPLNCLLVERAHWSREFNAAADKAGVAVLAVVRGGEDIAGLGFHGVVADPATSARWRDSGLPVVETAPRTRMRFDSADPVLATFQAVWPGVNATEDEAHAAPSGGPWIDTNAGFLRFARALTPARIWMANSPPAGKVYPAARYAQAVADAAMVGARWVVALDADLEKRLLAREEKALAAWKLIGTHLAYWESHPEWRAMEPAGKLAVVQDAAAGGLLSGSILDMITTKHTPVRPVPLARLSPERMAGTKMAVNADPAAITDEQREILRNFTRAGNTMLNAPVGFRFPHQREDQVVLDKDDVAKVDAMWKDVNSMTGRHNLGARLFNVAGMLSNLVAPTSGKPVVLHLVNYTDYAVENVTVHVLGRFGKARLLEPGGVDRAVALFEHEDGTGLEIDKVASVATIVLE